MTVKASMAIVAAVMTLGCAADPVRPGGAAAQLDVKGRRSGNPSVAASGRFVAVAWGASAPSGMTDVYVAVSVDGGSRFSGAVRVSDDQTLASLSGEQPPRVTLVPRADADPSIAVIWTTKGDAGTRLAVARSADGGRSFSSPSVIAASDAPGNRGWESLAATPDGRLFAVWLDHRELAAGAAAAGGHAMHEHATGRDGAPADSAARAQLSKLYFAALDTTAHAAGGVVTAAGRDEIAVPIAGGVCYCCKTALATGADGAIFAAWRHVYPGSRRDIAFTASRDGGRSFGEPVRISEDNWQLDGCPENGPAIAVDSSNRVHVVWPTLVQESGREALALFYASTADGRAFTDRARIPSAGAAYHPQVAVRRSGELVVAWEEAAGGPRRIRLAAGTMNADGNAAFRGIDAPAVGDGTYPAIATTPDGVFVAWLRQSESTSTIVTARIP